MYHKRKFTLTKIAVALAKTTPTPTPYCDKTKRFLWQPIAEPLKRTREMERLELYEMN